MSRPDGEMCVPFRVIEHDTGFDRRTVRVHVRRLARKGLAEFHKGLWSEDGGPAGAGYCITKAGVKLEADFPLCETGRPFRKGCCE